MNPSILFPGVEATRWVFTRWVDGHRPQFFVCLCAEAERLRSEGLEGPTTLHVEKQCTTNQRQLGLRDPQGNLVASAMLESSQCERCRTMTWTCNSLESLIWICQEADLAAAREGE